MIEVVVNLQGEDEKFDPKKLNNWVRNAVDGIDEDSWGLIAQEAVKDLPKRVTVQELMRKLSATLIGRKHWSYLCMAGRIEAVLQRMEVFGTKVPPTVRSVQERLVARDLMEVFDYTDYEWEQIEKAIDHSKDMLYPQFAIEQLRHKYALRDHTTGEEFESPQFVLMRMAMTIFSKDPVSDETKPLRIEKRSERTRVEHIIRQYELFSDRITSPPTPNYSNMGTPHKGFQSCCVTAAGDDRFSLAITDYINNLMTTQSAGIGTNYMTRSMQDPVQRGRFLHRGKKPYTDIFGKVLIANLQGSRGGAGTWYTPLFDPEARMIFGLRDTRAPADKSNRDCHFAYLTNRFMLAKTARDEQIFTWSPFTAPDLNEAFYGKSIDEFIRIYERYENDPTFKKNYVSAREVYLHALTQGFSTGTIYAASIDEMNRNSQFIDPIRSSNLCLEVCLPTEPYFDMRDLYSDREVGYARFHLQIPGRKHTVFMDVPASTVFRDDKKKRISAQDIKQGMTIKHPVMGPGVVTEIVDIKREPEVALCTLGAVNVTDELSDERYQEAAYYLLRMVDYCIHHSEYIMPHIGVTGKARSNAGIGMMGVATHMARRQLTLNSREGLTEWARLCRRHLYWVLSAAIEIGQERGLPAWHERNNFGDGWLPFDTAREEALALFDVPEDDIYDFDALRKLMIEHGGIGFSSLINFMPGESSSKALGVCNGIYGIRTLELNKTDGAMKLDWAAPYGDDPAYKYQSVYDLTIPEQNSWYAVAQVYCDQAPSADWFKDFRIQQSLPTSEMLRNEIDRVQKGLKTRYYINTMMPAKEDPMAIKKETDQNTPASDDALVAGLNFQGGDERHECAGCDA